MASCMFSFSYVHLGEFLLQLMWWFKGEMLIPALRVELCLL